MRTNRQCGRDFAGDEGLGHAAQERRPAELKAISALDDPDIDTAFDASQQVINLGLE